MFHKMIGSPSVKLLNPQNDILTFLHLLSSIIRAEIGPFSLFVDTPVIFGKGYVICERFANNVGYFSRRIDFSFLFPFSLSVAFVFSFPPLTWRNCVSVSHFVPEIFADHCRYFFEPPHKRRYF